MPEPISVTFRDQTTGRINDLLMDEDEACAQSQNLLGYLAGALLNYKDEGIEFTPSVLLCDAIQEFLKAFPGAVSHMIGSAPLDPSSGPKILKECAPLSSRNWFIFIERTDGGNVNYGVFTYFRLPTAIPLHEGININPNQFCVLVRKISTNTIEMRGAKGSVLTLIFSTLRESANSTMPIEKFASGCCARVLDEKISKDFKTYFSRLLDAALTSSHGTIMVCAEDLNLTDVPEMYDAVPVSPLLDFQAAFLEFQTANTAGSILSLQRCEELLQGFLRCDGMIVFDTSGRVTAYRVFFKPTEATSGTPNVVVGGARRRAFEGVKNLVGSRLVSVLFRSQDGLTLHHGIDQ
jgi:hypothetical protein